MILIRRLIKNTTLFNTGNKYTRLSKKKCLFIFILSICSCNSPKQIINTNGATVFFDTLCQENNLESNSECITSIKLYYKYRQETYPQLNFIDFRNDTLFIMQKMNYQSGSFHESIWNTKEKIEYKVSKGKLKPNIKHGAFNDEYYRFLNRGTMDSIQYYADKYENEDYAVYVTAIKIIVNNGKSNMECISFKEFDFPR